MFAVGKDAKAEQQLNKYRKYISDGRAAESMGKLIHHVTLELFSKAQEPLAASYRVLEALAPVPVAEIKEGQWHWHPERKRTKVWSSPKRKVLFLESETPGEDGPITVLTYRFSRQQDTQSFIERVRSAPEEERMMIVEALDDHLDGEGRLLLKLDKEALAKGTVRFSGRGEKAMARVTLAAFPKSASTCRETAKAIMGDAP